MSVQLLHPSTLALILRSFSHGFVAALKFVLFFAKWYVLVSTGGPE